MDEIYAETEICPSLKSYSISSSADKQV